MTKKEFLLTVTKDGNALEFPSKELQVDKDVLLASKAKK